MKDEKLKAAKAVMQDLMVDGVNAPEALHESIVIMLTEDFKVKYADAEREAWDLIDEVWDQAYCQAQEEMQEAQAWEEARRGAMMGAWV